MANTITNGGPRSQYQQTNENSLFKGEDGSAKNVKPQEYYADNYFRVPTTLQRPSLMARIGHVVAACLLTPVVIAFHLTVACIRIPLALAVPIILTVMKTVQLCQKKESFDLGKHIVVVTKRNMKEIGLKIQQAVNIVGIYSHIIDVLKGESQEE